MKKTIFFIFSLIFCFVLVGCEKQNDSVLTTNYYVSFINYDGSTLQNKKYNFGDFPEYSGEIPKKESDDEFIYVFDGWEPELVKVEKNAIYTAVFSKKDKYHKIHTLSFVEEKPATEELSGIKAHYVCSECEKKFLDEDGAQEITESLLIIPKIQHVHNLEYKEKVFATNSSNGIKEHYQCSKCNKLFLDSNGKNEVSADTLVLIYRVEDETISISYSFTGEEREKKGYAEGNITLSKTSNLTKNNRYDFYWGKDRDILQGFYPFYTETIKTTKKSISFTLPENTYIPKSSNQIIVYENDEYIRSFNIDEGKLLTDECSNYTFAAISDVHINYSQGEKHLTQALNQFENVGIDYVVLSGDIGESNSDYSKYRNACQESNYTGLIFASIGNHDQTTQGKQNFKSNAVYNGANKEFIPLNDIEEYFSHTYNNKLPVSAFYNDLEGNGSTNYYYVTIGKNLFFFMDQILADTGDSAKKDNFSAKELDYFESVLYKYSGTHTINEEFKYDKYNLFVVQHAPFEQYKVGDMWPAQYGGQMILSNDFKNNLRFASLLHEYSEAIMLTGHTHVRYDAGYNFTDKEYDRQGNLTAIPMARIFHVSSTSQPRWYVFEDGKYKRQSQTDYSAGSECYIVYQYGEDIVFEGNSLKEYTPQSKKFDETLYTRKVYGAYSYVIPTMINNHAEPIKTINFAKENNVEVKNGSPTIVLEQNAIKLTFNNVSDEVLFKTGSQSVTNMRDCWVKFVMHTDVDSFDVNGCDYDGTIKKTKTIDLTLFDGNNYKVTTDVNGKKIVQIKLSELITNDIIEQFALSITNLNEIGNVSIFELSINLFEDVRTRGKNIDVKKKLEIKNLSASTTLSFDYRIDNDGEIRIAFLDSSWGHYYGYYYFNKNGTKTNYVGITTTQIDFGYVRVELDLSALTITNNISNRENAPSEVNILYISPDSTAQGFMDNVNFL